MDPAPAAPAPWLAWFADYQPSAISNDLWTRLRPHVRVVLEHTVPTTGMQMRRQIRAATVHLHSRAQAGLELAAPAAWMRDQVEHTIATAVHGQMAPRTAGTYASLLRQISRLIAPASHGVQQTRGRKHALQQPYSTSELTTFLDWAQRQKSTAIRDQLLALLWLGLGTGAQNTDLRELRGTDIRLTECAVTVAYPDRTVPVHHSCEVGVLRVAAAAGDGLVFEGAQRDLASHLITRANNWNGRAKFARPTMQRLRNTWFALCLSDDAGLLALQQASGTRSDHRYADLADALTPITTARYETNLRGITSAPLPDPAELPANPPAPVVYLRTQS